MVKYHNDIIQGTDEWHQIRLGVITASNVNKLVTPNGALAKNQAMRDYAAQIAAQRIMKRIEDNFQSYDMIRGSLQESIARDVYNDNFAPVEECGFITNDDHVFTIGCSPDGLVGDDGGVEIKSRLAKFQIQTIIADEVPDEYVNQIQTFLLVSGREWCDFVQYSNGLPLFVKRVTPDPARQAAILAAILAFESEVFMIIDEYHARSSTLVPTEWVDFMTDDIITPSGE